MSFVYIPTDHGVLFLAEFKLRSSGFLRNVSAVLMKSSKSCACTYGIICKAIWLVGAQKEVGKKGCPGLRPFCRNCSRYAACGCQMW